MLNRSQNMSGKALRHLRARTWLKLGISLVLPEKWALARVLTSIGDWACAQLKRDARIFVAAFNS